MGEPRGGGGGDLFRLPRNRRGADRLDSTGLTDSTGTALNGEARQLSGAAWGSLRIAGDRTALTPALRFDYFFQDYIGREEIQRNALSWSLTAEAVWPNLTVELSGQSSYRNPSFRDLFWPSGAFASGNPDLLPERGLGADLGITWDLKAGITATAAGFVQQVSDLIQWLPAAGGIWRPRNIGEVEIYGGEVSLKGILPLGEAEGSGIPWFIEYQGVRLAPLPGDHPGSGEFREPACLPARTQRIPFAAPVRPGRILPGSLGNPSRSAVYQQRQYEVLRSPLSPGCLVALFPHPLLGDRPLGTKPDQPILHRPFGISRTGHRMDPERRISLLKSITLKAAALLGLLLFTACPTEVKTDYQAFREADPSRVLYLLNGSGETFSGLDCEGGVLYNDLQTLGHTAGSRGIPNDILIREGRIFVLLSGQNSIESYDAVSLDYVDRLYLKNGFNPLNFIPAGDTGYAFITGYKTDEVVLVDLRELSLASAFVPVYEAVSLPDGAHEESSAATTLKNGVGDNKHRGVTGGAVLLNGADSRLYLSNVRYDPKILLTDGDGNPVEYGGSVVRANGYFRQGTLSVLCFDADALGGGGSGDPSLALIREIDLDSLYRTAAGGESYFPGDGLNPQSLLLLEGRLHVVCTGTNGGEPRTFTAGEYIPPGYDVGDTVPGTDPDDGLVLILDTADGGTPDAPIYERHLAIGGSPAAFRSSVDGDAKIVYLAGVGGIHAYSYGPGAGDFSILRGGDNPVVTAENPPADYYSHLFYDSADRILYASFFSGSSLLAVSVSGPGSNPTYGPPLVRRTGDGPGALALWER